MGKIQNYQWHACINWYLMFVVTALHDLFLSSSWGCGWLDAAEQGEPAHAALSPWPPLPLGMPLSFSFWALSGDRRSKLSVWTHLGFCCWQTQSQALLTDLGLDFGCRGVNLARNMRGWSLSSDMWQQGVQWSLPLHSWALVVGPFKGNRSFSKSGGLKLKAVGRLKKNLLCVVDLL